MCLHSREHMGELSGLRAAINLLAFTHTHTHTHTHTRRHKALLSPGQDDKPPAVEIFISCCDSLAVGCSVSDC